MMNQQYQQAETDLPVRMCVCEIDRYPTGDYLDLSPDGLHSEESSRKLVPCPVELERQPEGYAGLWVSRGWDSAYIACSDRKVLARFLSQLPGLRHLALEASGWSLSFLEHCPGLRILEIRRNTHLDNVRKLDPIKSCDQLECLVIHGCNSVFANGAPELGALKSLVIRNVANLIGIDGLIDALSTGACPSLNELKMNDVRHKLDELDLGPLRSLKDLGRLQVVGTRVAEVDERFMREMLEREAIRNYVSKIPPDAREARLAWSGVHGDDIRSLAERASGLERLELEGCHDLLGLEEVAAFRDLVSLSISNCKRIGSVSCLSSLARLERLKIVDCPKILDCGELLGTEVLRELHVRGADGSRVQWDGSALRLVGVSGRFAGRLLDGLGGSVSASTLTMEECTQAFGIEQVGRCRLLRVVRIAHCPGIQSYLPLAQLRRLDALAIVGGSGEAISRREYEHEMAELQLEVPGACDFACDVPDEVLECIHEEVDVFFESLRIELGAR